MGYLECLFVTYVIFLLTCLSYKFAFQLKFDFDASGDLAEKLIHYTGTVGAFT